MNQIVCCIIVNGDSVLMGKKLYGFGKGFVQFPAGKDNKNEDFKNAVVREVKVETGLILDRNFLWNVGYIDYKFDDKSDFRMNVFRTEHFDGSIKKTKEFEPKWYKIKNIPYKQCFPDAKKWMPQAINGLKIVRKFNYSFDDF